MQKQPRAEGARDRVRVELALGRQQAGSPVVLLPQDSRRAGLAVQDFLELALEEGQLLLDDDDLVEACRELPHDLRVERPDHPQVQQADARAREPALVEPHVGKRLAQVVVALAAGDDADPRVGAEPLDQVHPVRARVCERGLRARAEQRALHLDRRGRQHAGVGGVLEWAPLPLDRRKDRRDAVGGDSRRAGGVGDVRDDLQRAPQPGRARAGPCVQAEVEHLLDGARVEGRDVQALEQRLGRARDRRRLRVRVVAHDDHGAAGARDARVVGVTQRVGRAVDAGRLAVPHGENAVEARAGKRAGQLRAPRRGRAQLLVQPRDGDDVVLLAHLPLALELPVEPAEWGALVAGDERARASGRGARRRGSGRTRSGRAPGSR